MLGLRLRGFPAWFAARTYHLAVMPGMARRVRLGIDWAVGLVFGRASAELGQLGHPPSLGTYLDEAAAAPARARPPSRRRVSELTFREGRASDIEAVYRLGEVAWDESRRARRADRRRSGAASALYEDWGHERPLMEFMTAQPGGCFLVARRT